MSQSGATVSQECITAYNDLKLSKKYKFIIYKLSDDNKEIVVEEASADKDWDTFREKLINATTKSKSAKMVYASSKEALKRSLTGIATELQANDPDDIEYDSILKTVSKGMAG
ncbi:Cofilin [Colletotrichum tanaceti]|uniref:Cofilin n=1 Tax=Colletotrichum tanaceti TaxID=1306861 RepID=A0A4U6XDF1_9PEZI|nr:Cofilin [Colletotrichum tanaceti]